MSKTTNTTLAQIQAQVTLSLLEQTPSSLNQLFADNRLPFSISHACQTMKQELHPGRTESLKRCQIANSGGFLAIDFVILKHLGLELEGLSFNYASTAKQPILSHSFVSSAIVYPKDRFGQAFDAIPYRLEPHISQSLAISEYPYRTATQEMLEVVKQAKEDQIPFEGVLVDGEFTSKEALIGLAKISVPIIGRFRTDVKVKFEDESLSVKTLAQRFLPGKSRYYKRFECYAKRVKVNIVEVGCVELIIIWKRTSNGLDLCVLVNTYSGGLQTILAAWKARWALEVCHRLYKQNFGLGKCQARAFSTQLMHASLVLRAYYEVRSLRAIEAGLSWRVAQARAAELFRKAVLTEFPRVAA
jgi:hypothetical protein